jgi:hypothetical protein
MLKVREAGGWERGARKGGEVEGRWGGGGGEVEGRWRGGAGEGGEVEGRWRGGGRREMISDSVSLVLEF